MKHQSIFFLACLGLAAAGSSTATAAVTWHNVQFGGFLSQGYLDSTNNNYPVETKGGTFDFREYGLNASTTFGAHFRIGAQVFGQKLGKYGGDRPILDWAVADYNFAPEFGIQVGRLKYPRSMYSDVLDLDVVRPFVFLPQSIYDNRLRDFQASFDGVKIYGSINAGQSSFDYKVYYGNIPMKTDSGVADFFNNTGVYASPPGVTHIKTDSVKGASLTWNTPLTGLRFGGGYSELKHLAASGGFVAAPSFAASLDLETADYSSLSAEYTTGPWTVSAEYMLLRFHVVQTLPAFVGPPSTSVGQWTSYYISIARRIGSKFEVGTYYDVVQDDRSGSVSAPQNHRRDWSVGVRYDFNDHLLFKIEGDWIDGVKDFFNVPGISNPPASLKSHTFLISAKTTISF